MGRGRVEDAYDVVVVGSGFGGSVAALRLTEKGYRVAVLEAGARYEDDELPRTSWDLREFLWAPALGFTGIQRVHMLRDVLILAGAGVGGGSLNYANTLYEPKTAAFYDDPQWADITDWRSELAPYYDQARRMLGVVTNPTTTAADEVMRAVADEMDAGDTFHMADVGVFFGRDGRKEPGREVPDPFFGGAGPRRRGCIECGECMTGCRHNAKNSLLKNYLHLAESAGAEVHPLTTVTAVREDGDGSYLVETRETGPAWRRRPRRTFRADQVVVAAGTWGTQRLLHQLKADGRLPRISDRLGELTRTNSEAVLAASTRWRNRGSVDYSRGVAITSSFHPNEHTHVEPVRYGTGSNSMALLAAPLLDGDSRWPRWALMLLAVLLRPVAFVAHYFGLKDWSNRSIIALVMQTHDNSLTVRPRSRRRRGRVRLTSRQGRGEPNPTWIPEAAEAVTRIADHIDGRPYGSIGETFDVAATAHFLGGCPIGATSDEGVIDGYHRLFGHDGVHVVDGSAVSANLGVNPSLTITAQAERAMAMWPNKGEEDPRPDLGEAYRRVAPVAPGHPVVPATAPGALRLPIVSVSGAAPEPTSRPDE